MRQVIQMILRIWQKARIPPHGPDIDKLETARTQDDPNVKTLIEQITPKAKSMFRIVMMLMVGMMDASTRAAVLQEIEAVLEREVEKA
jgi:hypothetical protein